MALDDAFVLLLEANLQMDNLVLVRRPYFDKVSGNCMALFYTVYRLERRGKGVCSGDANGTQGGTNRLEQHDGREDKQCN